VAFIEELGAHRCYHGQFAGQDFAVQGPPLEGIPQGFAFTMPASAIHFFDAESGLRIETAGALAVAAEPV
ncbi:hypothetical protein ABTN18_19635, partial [Acinetobacter baumannii]